ncbi:MAG: hypothetical protein ACOYL6_07130 [Bacteriovoracaceae bacterium]
MKTLFLSLLISSTVNAAELKCGLYKLTGMMTNGKTNVLVVMEKDQTQSFFIDASCPAIPEGHITGEFQVSSVTPLTAKCTQKRYKNFKGENYEIRFLKSKKCN